MKKFLVIYIYLQGAFFDRNGSLKSNTYDILMKIYTILYLLILIA